MEWLAIFLVIFLILAFLRVPVAFSMGFATIVTMVAAGVSLKSIPIAYFNGLNSFTFLAIPAFIVAGDLMGSSGISTSILTFTNAIIGRMRGSLGATTVVTSLLFGTLTGSSLATVTAIGGMMLPEMQKRGYSKKYSTALIASCGFLGILVPPSIPGIVYAMMSGESLMKIWLCTLTPGILVGIAYIVINYIRVGRKEPLNAEPFHIAPYVRNIGVQFWRSLLALLMPFIIFYGIYGGIFTPTEAGGMAVFYGILVGWVILPFFKKRWPDKKFFDLLSDSAVSSASVCAIICLAAITGRMIIFTRVPQDLTNVLHLLTSSKIVFLFLVNVILLIAGMFMETNSAVMLLGPILIPVAKSYGVDPVHFAAIVLLNMEICIITPPMAGNLLVACRVDNLNMDEVLGDLIPFFIAALVCLGIITYIPEVSLFIPNWIMG
ncbi:MAG: TRAP transporter large permease [Planctomycetaceae bacterium]|nr:TRAP transporter large permease [Planctomycetaceae bacterium]